MALGDEYSHEVLGDVSGAKTGVAKRCKSIVVYG